MLQEPGAGQPETGAIKLNTLIEIWLRFAADPASSLVPSKSRPICLPTLPRYGLDASNLAETITAQPSEMIEAVSAGNNGLVRVSTAPWGAVWNRPISKSALRIQARASRLDISGSSVPAGLEYQGTRSSWGWSGGCRELGTRSARSYQLPVQRARNTFPASPE